MIFFLNMILNAYDISLGGKTMKANQVMEILQISRSTLKHYREKGLIKATQKPTGQFEFDNDSVWLFRNNILLARLFSMVAFLLINKSKI